MLRWAYNFAVTFTLRLGHMCVLMLVLVQTPTVHSTLGRASNRVPIQSVMKRITIADRAPATCGEERGKIEAR